MRQTGSRDKKYERFRACEWVYYSCSTSTRLEESHSYGTGREHRYGYALQSCVSLACQHR